MFARALSISLIPSRALFATGIPIAHMTFAILHNPCQSVASRVTNQRLKRSARRRVVGRAGLHGGYSSLRTCVATLKTDVDEPATLHRRTLISAGCGALFASFFPSISIAAELQDSKMVGAYLPESADVPGFHVFVAGSTRTPALRAGALDPYQILLPAQWKEAPVSNARSGNYCQPRCDEATTEVQFVDPSSGSAQIIIIPTTKLLISKQDPSIEDVGTISGILDAISPAITGSVAVEAEEVASMEAVKLDGKTYYKYDLVTPFAESGLHNLAIVSTSKNYVMIATIGASEKQWSKSENDLKTVIDSFRC